MDNIITYVKPLSPLRIVFGLVVFLGGFSIFILQNILFGSFMMSFAVFLASTEGTQLNLNAKTYRNIWSIFGIHFGKWKAIPEFEYISVFKGKQKQRVNGLGATTSFSDEVFLINLFYNRNKHITFYRSFDKQKAFEVAKHFKYALGLDILDATEREQKWLEEESN